MASVRPPALRGLLQWVAKVPSPLNPHTTTRITDALVRLKISDAQQLVASESSRLARSTARLASAMSPLEVLCVAEAYQAGRLRNRTVMDALLKQAVVVRSGFTDAQLPRLVDTMNRMGFSTEPLFDELLLRLKHRLDMRSVDVLRSLHCIYTGSPQLGIVVDDIRQMYIAQRGGIGPHLSLDEGLLVCQLVAYQSECIDNAFFQGYKAWVGHHVSEIEGQNRVLGTKLASSGDSNENSVACDRNHVCPADWQRVLRDLRLLLAATTHVTLTTRALQEGVQRCAAAVVDMLCAVVATADDVSTQRSQLSSGEAATFVVDWVVDVVLHVPDSLYDADLVVRALLDGVLRHPWLSDRSPTVAVVGHFVDAALEGNASMSTLADALVSWMHAVALPESGGPSEIPGEPHRERFYKCETIAERRSQLVAPLLRLFARAVFRCRGGTTESDASVVETTLPALHKLRKVAAGSVMEYSSNDLVWIMRCFAELGVTVPMALWHRLTNHSSTLTTKQCSSVVATLYLDSVARQRLGGSECNEREAVLRLCSERVLGATPRSFACAVPGRLLCMDYFSRAGHEEFGKLE